MSKSPSLDLFTQELNRKRGLVSAWVDREMVLVSDPIICLGEWKATHFLLKRDMGVFVFFGDGSFSIDGVRKPPKVNMFWRHVSPGTVVVFDGPPHRISPRDYLAAYAPFVFTDKGDTLVISNVDSSLLFVLERAKHDPK
jgi:hypothetical protein